MLFRPNIVEPVQVAELVRAMRRASPAGFPLAVSVDQEGGLVQRLRQPLTLWPDMFSVAAAGDPARTEAVGRGLGDELAALGIGWNFAPVLDVHTNPANPVIGNRAFGVTPTAVQAHALAFWRGLRAAGVLGCGKHFPGHGDTQTDSHLDLPVVVHEEARLRAVELAPFAAAVAAGLSAIMTAHVLYPAWECAAAGHPVAADRARYLARGSRLCWAVGERRSGHAGGGRPLAYGGIGGAKPAGGGGPLPGARAAGATGSGLCGPGARSRDADRGARAGAGERGARGGFQGSAEPAHASRPGRVAGSAGHARASGPGRLVPAGECNCGGGITGGG